MGAKLASSIKIIFSNKCIKLKDSHGKEGGFKQTYRAFIDDVGPTSNQPYEANHKRRPAGLGCLIL